MKFLRRTAHVVSMLMPLGLLVGTFVLLAPLEGRPSQAATQESGRAKPDQPKAPPPINITVTAPQKTTEERDAERSNAAQQIAIQQSIAGYTKLLVVVGFLDVLAIAFGLGYTARAANAAKASAQVARESLTRLQRPFVSLKSYDVTWLWDNGRPGKFFYALALRLENTGPLPTRDLTLVDRCELRDTQLPNGFLFDYPDDGPAGPSLMGPQTMATCKRVTITDDALLAVQNETKFFYIFGKAEYRDWFDGTPVHKTTFCHRIIVEAGTPLDPRDPNNPKGSSIQIVPYMHHEYNYSD